MSQHIPEQFDSLPIWLRIWHLIGDPQKGIEPLIPISRTMLYDRIKSGRFPAPDHRFGERIAAWHKDQIRPFVIFAGCDGGPDHPPEDEAARTDMANRFSRGPHTPKATPRIPRKKK